MLKGEILKRVLSTRLAAIDRFRRNPIEVQDEVFHSLMELGAKTKFGAEFNLSPSISKSQFASKVELYNYDSFKPYIERALNGESDVCVPGAVKMYARSSGTTSDRSKYIPISQQNLWNSHLRGMRDVSTIYNSIYPQSRVLDGKVLTLGGSCQREGDHLIGDLSGIIVKRFHITDGWLRMPRMATAILANFEEKCERICKECVGENITSFAGVPSWNLALMSRILEYTGKNNLREVWPNLELFIHGGIEMTPYRQAFNAIDGGELRYLETYNASEGFFAIADDLSRDDMLLMLDYDTYFEFREGNNVVPLEGVEQGVVYAVIITSSNGLWRYEIGDTVEFTSLDPYRIRFAGRTRQYINAFGEEVIVDNSDRAIVVASEATGAVVRDYMVAPRFMDLEHRGCHQWLIEFVKRPNNYEQFVERLDAELRAINSDYDAKRQSTLDRPDVTMLDDGLFLKWMYDNRKNKVPRLCNDRKVMDQLLAWIERNRV